MEDNKNLPNNDDQELFLKAVEGLKDNSSIGHKKTVKGKVVQVDESDVFIDFDFKSEGKIKRSEFDKEPVIGEEVEAVITGEDDNNILLSKVEVDKRKAQDIIDNAVRNNTTVKGVVKDITKAHAIDEMLKYLGASLEDTYAFGDGPNDLEMLQYVQYGTAMGNAEESVLGSAKYRTEGRGPPCLNPS